MNHIQYKYMNEDIFQTKFIYSFFCFTYEYETFDYSI